jgi:hypothetical protein
MTITLNEKESAEYIKEKKIAKEIYKKYNELIDILKKHVVIGYVDGIGTYPKEIIIQGKDFDDFINKIKRFYYQDLED